MAIAGPIASLPIGGMCVLVLAVAGNEPGVVMVAVGYLGLIDVALAA